MAFGEEEAKMTDCIEWGGRLTNSGYGGVYSPSLGRMTVAHRQVVAAIHGWDAIKGKVVAHKCDNRKCVRYGHLFITDYGGNTADMFLKGRASQVGETHTGSKLTDDSVREIRSRYAAGGVLMRELADEFGVKREAIGKVVRGERWAHVQ